MRKLLNDIYKYIGGLRIFRMKKQSRDGYYIDSEEELNKIMYRRFFPEVKNAGIFSKSDQQNPVVVGEPIIPSFPLLKKLQEDSKHTMHAILRNSNLNKGK